MRRIAIVNVAFACAILWTHHIADAVPGASHYKKRAGVITFSVANSTPLSEAQLQAYQAEVRNEYLHAWNAYKTYAFGADELQPISKEPGYSRNGWGATIVDGLDTAIIMGLTDELPLFRSHIANISWLQPGPGGSQECQIFETLIRYLGGLLSAHDLTQDDLYLTKAKKLADQVLMPAFKGEGNLPYRFVKIGTMQHTSDPNTNLAEAGTIQLELMRLSQLTGDPIYAYTANEAINTIITMPYGIPGLKPMSLDASKAVFQGDTVTFGGGGDSYYEYLLKSWMLSGQTLPSLVESWQDAITSAQKYMPSSPVGFANISWLASLEGTTQVPSEQELLCFLPGNVLMGAKLLSNQAFATFAEQLMQACSEAWNTPTGLASEVWDWVPARPGDHTTPASKSTKLPFNVTAPEYLLRPETLESLFYFYRITGNPIYQKRGYEIFSAIKKNCRLEVGYSSISDVTQGPSGGYKNLQDSYFFAETLKYSYLLFSPTSTISLNDWVFNTESHPMKLSTSYLIQA